MSKKISAIFLSLFLVGVLSVSCSNKDKTAPDTSTPKTINIKYAGIWESNNGDSVEIDMNGNIYEYQNSSRGAKGEIIEANDPNYKIKIYGDEFTITFSDTKNAAVNINGQEVTYTKTSKDIEDYNGNKYVSENMGGNYLWISIENGLVAMTPNTDANTPPTFYGYMSGMAGYGTDYNFWSSDRSSEGTLKFSTDGNSVTVTLTRNDPAPEAVGQDFVCYKK
ncbi:hypothetical protein [Brachyspira hampsonii]|uniref:Lipocalin-like domain-containing protein n=1 Tax=Brachyspira hampsonii 30446 TaxID=1289135 RepID=A0A2U4EWY1_9SPIR|nr:hypothetical protein [Brachyspira hampsonii]EKV57618.1 hypothetical protein A966_04501 [Brachyspira hampsonii 30446]MBW5390047.1 hypothetical protein [Brachyspira hampsonii]MBW5394106.1 hypothetical protein [Brachyspira hampsonii]OEJ17208.1 hypothetical protein A9495_07785 [Brachyspira hampsonii]PTY39730.1 hypothetical protein DQ06_03720 [Brachyspira hampsonii bv. II]